jgi:hypothetical protein
MSKIHIEEITDVDLDEDGPPPLEDCSQQLQSQKLNRKQQRNKKEYINYKYISI